MYCVVSSRSRLSSFLSPAAPSGLDCVHSAESQLLWGTVGKLGSAQQPAGRSSIYPASQPASVLQGVLGRFLPLSPDSALQRCRDSRLPLEESAPACPAVDLGCRLRGWPCRRCPDRGVKAEGAALQQHPLHASLIMEAVY